jgi:predicted Zn-dependent protease
MTPGLMTPEQRLAGFRKFAAERPDDPFTRYSLAMQLRAMSLLEEAVAEFRELGRRSPDYLPTWLMLGQALEGLGREAEAGQAYRDGIAEAGRQANHHARGELEEALGRLSAQGR